MAKLEITTTSKCPLMCTFCPQDKLTANYPKGDPHYLSLENFKKVLSKLPKNVTIDFGGFTEPFSNPECLDLIKLAINAKFNIVLHSTFYKVKPDTINEIKQMLLDKKIRQACWHLPDGSKNMTGFRYNKNYKYALEVLCNLENLDFMSMSPNGVLDKDVHDCILNIKSFPTKKLPKGWTAIRRANNLDTKNLNEEYLLPRVKHSDSVTCKFTPFMDHNVLLPNGNVSLCCMDYGQKNILGNLLEEDYSKLFKSNQFMKLSELNRSEGVNESICKWCSEAVTYKFNNHSCELERSIPLDKNGRRHTNLWKKLDSYNFLPNIVKDKVIDISRYLKRVKKGQYH